MQKYAFTLTEILIGLLIIGMVAALSLPVVITSTNQYEYRTGLRKAVSALNTAIKMANAEDGDSTYDSYDLEKFFKRRMNVITSVKSREKNVTRQFAGRHKNKKTFVPYKYENAHFYTADGMIFEFPSNITGDMPLYETDQVRVCANSGNSNCRGCGSMGLSYDDRTQKPPCLIVVDVNGDKEPNAPYIASRVYSSPTGIRISDVFSLMITEKNAIPYGLAAQRTLYKVQK